MNKKQILKKITKLRDLYLNEEIKTLSKHEVNPGLERSSRENYLYFTLPVCVNFQRSSPAMWQSALDTWNDPETNYLFFPEKVVRKPERAVKTDLAKHNLAIQRNKHPLIWSRICNTLHAHFGDDPKQVIEMGHFDAGEILKLLQTDKKEWFPYLGGKKLSNYWLFILSLFTDANLKNLNFISIIPDTHVVQSSVELGLVENDATPEVVDTVWRELLSETRISPVDMHSALWNWSRNNFTPKV